MKPFFLVELLVITLNHECRVIDLEGGDEVVLIQVGLARTLTILGQILVEGDGEVAFEDCSLSMALELCHQLVL